VKKILSLTVGVLLVIGLIGVGTFAISQDVEAGTAPTAPFFFFGDLTISPTEVDIGQIVTISITVRNTGDMAGSHEVTLKIDGVVEATKKVTLEISASEKVTFTISKDVAGTYSVAAGGHIEGLTSHDLTGSFTVWEVLPTTTTPTTTTPTTTTPTTTTPTTTTPTTTTPTTTIPTTTTPTTTTPTTTTPTPDDQEPFNWALIGGIIAAVVVVVVLVFFLVRRKAA